VTMRRFHGDMDFLRSAERRARLEVDRVVAESLAGAVLSSVLDVGTGTGVFAEAFAAKGMEAAGIDISREMIKKARLHETDDPRGTLKEARRVARKRVTVLEWPCLEEEHGPTLAHRLEPDAARALAREAGFSRADRKTLSHMELYILEP